MKKSTLVLIIVASSLVALGLLTFGVAMSMLNFNFRGFGDRLEVNTHEVGESIESINVSTDVGKVVLIPSNDGRCVVECSEQSKVLHEVSIENGELKITINDQRKWYEHISFGITGEIYVKIYLPESEYKSIRVKASTAKVQLPSNFSFEDIDIELSTGDVDCRASATGLIRIKVTTGDVELEGISAGSLDLKTSTGDIELDTVSCTDNVSIAVTTGDVSIEDLRCKKIDSTGSTGDILLENVIVSERICIDRSTGDVTFERSDAAEIKVKTDTGKVRGSLLTDKIFYTHTDTGKVNVPKSTSGGICEIETDTGNISISIQP